jgi:hypothetical protein
LALVKRRICLARNPTGRWKTPGERNGGKMATLESCEDPVPAAWTPRSLLQFYKNHKETNTLHIRRLIYRNYWISRTCCVIVERTFMLVHFYKEYTWKFMWRPISFICCVVVVVVFTLYFCKVKGLCKYDLGKYKKKSHVKIFKSVTKYLCYKQCVVRTA